ncbi:glycosyltransferase family 4 protein [Bordetella holmesii]|uniref:Glycosyltransferases group 1 n=1 Tax=Bordetella holmesii CDC-H585-BH TaxID=1331206 RepID=A0A158M8N0_9BORD|nr:glycosyltransferase [Bordetella holmesii]AMD45212.1 hypothetical protein H558_06695 [Bordetella holmesii H558]AMD49349.1 hypothetical protein F783_011400 [Bordetella holmesii F627]KAK79199.1 glycosyltransferases group 1 [Bordetella holmesii CDC-H809-BH]KAK86193.1 glycosyltransferases group 1 [Bordetella holmesii CDC-H572-BH]KAK99602.1 glycosyltransferases group 1 [Bordetella holmesii CDC-H585-BH]KAL01356.1 glycosyltransferases group 1 [Bordetella holmesii CDC-H635-BH]KCV11127.1 glycosyltr
MRIAYLTFEIPGDRSGVAKKIAAQADAWRRLGHHVQHFVLAPAESVDSPNVSRILSSGVRPPILAAALSGRSIGKALSQWQPDIVYLRQMLWWPGAIRAISVAPLVIEYNSIARNEYRRSAPTKYLIECMSRKRFPRAASGLVAVTQELVDDVPAVGHALRTVISNGYDFGRVVPRTPPSNQRPQLLLVGSPGQDWHGVDKVIRMAVLLPEFDFHLVVPGLAQSGPANVHFHGGLYGEALAQRYAQTDVALGTLALLRKGMRQAAPLKTREYLAYGLPVIAGYEDADLRGAPYWLDIGNTESKVEDAVQAMRDFVLHWQGRILDRADARRRLDYAVKEVERLAFFEQVRRHVR